MSFEFSQGRSSAIASNRCIMAVFFSVPKVALHHSLEVVAGFRLKDWPGHKPSRAPSLEVHLARRQAYQGASFSSSIAKDSNPLLGAGFKVELF